MKKFTSYTDDINLEFVLKLYKENSPLSLFNVQEKHLIVAYEFGSPRERKFASLLRDSRAMGWLEVVDGSRKIWQITKLGKQKLAELDSQNALLKRK